MFVVLFFVFVFFFKQKTAYEMRISDWSSDVCSSDLDRLACILLARLPVWRIAGRRGVDRIRCPILRPGRRRGRRADPAHMADRAGHLARLTVLPDFGESAHCGFPSWPDRTPNLEGFRAQNGKASCRKRVCKKGE